MLRKVGGWEGKGEKLFEYSKKKDIGSKIREVIRSTLLL